MKPELHTEVTKSGILLDRELSQLTFNRRVMAQAEDPNIPLLERLRYLCIVSSNMDEFFEVRVASLLAAGSLAPQHLASLVAPMLLVMVSVGMAIPACQLAVLQPYGAQAGSASGLFFFVQMAITAACGAVIAAITDGSEKPLLWVTAAASAAFALVWRLTKRQPARATACLTSRS